MSVIGGYGTGGSASAIRYSTVDELLNQLPDNTANLIDAPDIRDAIFSLWSYVDDVQVVASQSASINSYYTNSAQVPITVGGITAGMSFSGTYSIQDMFDMLLYPYVQPGCAITSTPNTKEYGDTLSVNLNWTVTKNTNTITSIIVNGTPVSPTGNSQAGSQIATGTHSTSPGLSQTNTFTITTSDGTSTPSASATLLWRNRRYWGSINLSSIGNPDLNTNPGSASLVSSFITMTTTSNTLTNLTGAGVGTGREFATTMARTFTSINGGGYHLIFGFPTAFGTPNFSVNGLPSTAFTKVKSNVAFTNPTGFSGTNYDVWISNTAQNSPLSIVIS